MKQTPYFGTFSAAVDIIQSVLAAAQALPVHNGQNGQPNWDETIYSQGPVNYGQTIQVHLELKTLKSKPTRKFFHVSLYRMDSGRYELTSYIL
jgi:hypothetical protein